MGRQLKVGDRVDYVSTVLPALSRPDCYTVVEVGLMSPRDGRPSYQIVRLKWDGAVAPDTAWYAASRFPLATRKYELVRVIEADSTERAKMLAAMAGAAAIPPVNYEVREVK